MSDISTANRWLIVIAVITPTLIEVLDTSVANVALAHIQGSISAGQEEVTWVLTSYLVANAIVIPMSGWLSSVFGRKNYLLISIVVFTISSLLCGAATSLSEIIIFRIIQGIGGGGLQPLSQSILMETFPIEKRGVAMSIFGLGVVLGPILGPVMGGYLTDNYSWRWIFWINLPIGLFAYYMVKSYVFDPVYMSRRQKGEQIDVTGLALLTFGIGALQVVLDRGQQEDWMGSDFIVYLSVIAAVALVFLVVWELRHPNPILNLRILKNISFTTGSLVMFFGYFAFFGSLVLLPQFLQSLLGYTAFQAGMVLGPGGLLTLLVMPIVGRLTEKIDARFLLCFGLGLCSISLFHMSGFTLETDFATAAYSRLIQGAAMPFFFVSLSLLSFASVKLEEMNNASAIYNLLRNLGGSFGVAFVTTVLARRSQYHQSVLSEHLNPLNYNYTQALDNIMRYLEWQTGSFGDLTLQAQGVIYEELIRQATSLAFNDAFLLQAWLFVILIGAVWIIKKAPVGGKKVIYAE